MTIIKIIVAIIMVFAWIWILTTYTDIPPIPAALLFVVVGGLNNALED